MFWKYRTDLYWWHTKFGTERKIFRIHNDCRSSALQKVPCSRCPTFKTAQTPYHCFILDYRLHFSSRWYGGCSWEWYTIVYSNTVPYFLRITVTTFVTTKTRHTEARFIFFLIVFKMSSNSKNLVEMTIVQHRVTSCVMHKKCDVWLCKKNMFFWNKTIYINNISSYSHRYSLDKLTFQLKFLCRVIAT